MYKRQDIKTAVSEAVTNCIVHAYPDRIGPITMTAAIYELSLIHISTAALSAAPVMWPS